MADIPDESSLKTMSVVQLKTLCKTERVKNYSSLRKEMLVQALCAKKADTSKKTDGWDKRARNKRSAKPKTNEVDFWTPQTLFDALSGYYGPFDLDAAASKHNAKVENFYDQNDNSLVQDWVGRVWCNPPYGRENGASKGTSSWIIKAYEETKVHCNADVMLMLVPCYTDLSIFHSHVLPYVDEIVFIQSRVKFEGPNICDGGTSRNPSAVLVFRKGDRDRVKIGSIYRDGTKFKPPR